MSTSFNSNNHLYFCGLELVTINLALFLNNLSLKENWFQRDVHEERTYFPEESEQFALSNWNMALSKIQQKCVKTENMIRTILFQLRNVRSVSLQYGKF